MNPSNHSSLSSPPQLATLLDIFPFQELRCSLDTNPYEFSSTFDHLGETLPNNDHFRPTLINTNSRSSISDYIPSTSFELEDEKTSYDS